MLCSDDAHFQRLLIVVATISVAVLTTVSLSAAMNPGDEPSPSRVQGASPGVSSDSEELRTAVRQLGDSSFAVRMSANRRLLESGIESLPFLREAVGHPDRELSHRVKRLVGFLERLELKLKVESFAKSTSPEDYELPCWESFRKLMDGDPETQQLFAKMVLSDESLLQSAAIETDEQFAETFSLRVQTVGALRASADPARLGELPSLLFCFHHRKPDADFTTVELLIEMARQAAVKSKPGMPAHGRPIQNLMRIALIENEEVPDERIIRLEVPAAVPRAVRVAKDRAGSMRLRQQAMDLVYRIGGRDRIDVFESLFDDPTEFPRFGRDESGKAELSTTLGDIALFYAIRLAKLKLEDFDVDESRLIGFESDETRTAAREKWQEIYSRTRVVDKQPETPSGETEK